MSNEPQLIWEKELGKFRLAEYQKRDGLIPCNVYYSYGGDEYGFYFGGWGTDRELISEQHCLLLCQYMIDCNCNISMSSFAENLACAIADCEEEIE